MARPLPASAETGLGLGNLGRPAWPGPNGQGAAARARPQDEGRARRRRRCAKAALRESGGVARAPVYWSKIFCSTPPPRRFRRARLSRARWGLRKAMRAAPTVAGRPRARLRTAPCYSCALLLVTYRPLARADKEDRSLCPRAQRTDTLTLAYASRRTHLIAAEPACAGAALAVSSSNSPALTLESSAARTRKYAI